MRRIYRDKGLLLIPLPGNKGLNIGRYFTGYCSVREWPWAVYDFADHVSPWSSKADWADSILAEGWPILCVGCKGLLDVDRVESHYINPRCDDCNMDLAIARDNTCSHPVTRNLDCDDHGRECTEVVCADCGASVDVILNTCPRCKRRDSSVLLDNDGEPYMCDECWDDN